MLWVIFTWFLALVGGLAGWTLGGQPSAAAFTIAGAFVAVGIRDVTHHKHAIASVTILAATLGCYFGGWVGFLPAQWLVWYMHCSPSFRW
jgi:hypothetical protein